MYKNEQEPLKFILEDVDEKHLLISNDDELLMKIYDWILDWTEKNSYTPDEDSIDDDDALLA